MNGIFRILFLFSFSRRKGKRESAFSGTVTYGFLFANVCLLITDLRYKGVLLAAEDGAVAGPGVFVEFIQVLHQFGPQGVEMDVADQFEEIRIFFADDGFVAVLEEMACAFVSFVEGHGVSGHEAAHYVAEWGRAGT